MSAQLPFDFTKRARGSDPETSHAAAKRAIDFAHGHFALILGALAAGAMLTIYELAAVTGLTPVQVARRCAELHDAERITPTGETRLSPSGRACRVWKLSQVNQGDAHGSSSAIRNG